MSDTLQHSRSARNKQFSGTQVTVGGTTVTLDEEIYSEIDRFASRWDYGHSSDWGYGHSSDLGKAVWSCTRPDGKRLALKAEAPSTGGPFNVTREATVLLGPLRGVSHTASLVAISVTDPFEPLGISYSHGGSFMMLTELCGPDFGSRTSPLSLTQACMVTYGLLNALEEMHDAGVIHRNIKPGNVCLRTAVGTHISITSLLSSVDLSDVVLIDCATAVTLSLCDEAHAAKSEFTDSATRFNLANHASFRDKPSDAAVVENSTARGAFSSVTMLDTSEYASRRDDIECISYFLADILSLDWSKARKHQTWSELKNHQDPLLIFESVTVAGGADVCAKFVAYSRTLSRHVRPDYNHLRQLLPVSPTNPPLPVAPESREKSL